MRIHRSLVTADTAAPSKEKLSFPRFMAGPESLNKSKDKQGVMEMANSATERVAGQQLSEGEARLLVRIQEAGAEGIRWSRSYSATLGRLARKGLVAYSMGPLERTEDRSRTGMRFVTTSAGKSIKGSAPG
jgi:hypothetical protein